MSKRKNFTKWLIIILALGLVMIGGTSLFVLKATAQTEAATTPALAETASANDDTANQAAGNRNSKANVAFIAAALAVGIGSIGAGIAVGNIGTAAMGTIGEKPELAGSALIYVGLAEGIAIYGLIIAIMILGKV
jgi:V/A-type H+-transporting ATPase subunit K